MPTPRRETLPEAWVLRCESCHGGILYGVAIPLYNEALLSIIGDEYPPNLLWSLVEMGPIDRIWEIDYCACQPTSLWNLRATSLWNLRAPDAS